MAPEKIAHLIHIGGTAIAGAGAESLVSSFDPSQAVSVVQIVAQIVIAAVTAFAALKKALQKPVVAPKVSDSVTAA